MIILNNISKNFGKQKVISDFSLHIEQGSFLSISGQSGSGKSTLLNIMGLLEKPDKGTISINGKRSFTSKERLHFYRYQAGFLFQNFALIESKTVDENLRIAMTYHKPKNQSSSDIINRVLTELDLPHNITQKKVFQLSGGEQQRISLARILIKKPQYIFADEPTGNLDSNNRDIVFARLQQLNEQGKTVILVTHDDTLVRKSAQHIQL